MTLSIIKLFRYAECRALFIVMLNVVMLSVVMVDVVMLSVVKADVVVVLFNTVVNQFLVFLSLSITSIIFIGKAGA
jgi:hypothetical protein